jgi:hypothetical protein
MKCKWCQEHLLDFVTGALSADARRDLEEHLAGCPSCRSEAAELGRTWETLGTLPEERPTPALRARFYAMLEQAKAGASVSERPAPARGLERVLLGWWPSRPALQFGFAVVLLVAGLGAGWVIRPEAGPDHEIAALRSELASMRQEMTVAMLTQASSVERLLAISNIRQTGLVGDPLLETLIRTANSDPSVNVRLAAVDALAGCLDRRPVREELYRSLLAQTSPMVQISMIDALAGAGDGDSRHMMKNLIEDTRVDPDVRSHARKKLEEYL